MLIFLNSSEMALIKKRVRFDFYDRLRIAWTKIPMATDAIVRYANPAIA